VSVARLRHGEMYIMATLKYLKILLKIVGKLHVFLNNYDFSTTIKRTWINYPEM
jgi:hypothetical protein